MWRLFPILAFASLVLSSGNPLISQNLFSQDEVLRKIAGHRSQNILGRLSGEWTIESGSNQGKKLTPDQLKGTLVVIKDQTILVLDPDKKELYKASFEVDATGKPFKIDMVTTTPNVPETKGLGIFQFSKRGWKLCYSLSNGTRPAKFASPKGSKVMLFELVAAPKHQE